MNQQYPEAEPMSPWRTMFCVSAYAMMSMFALLILLSGVHMVCKMTNLYGWLLRGEVSYNEDWSAEQRSAIDDFVNSLKIENSYLLEYTDYYDPPEPGTWKYAAWKDAKVMPVAADIDKKVREAALGMIPQQDDNGSVAHVAAEIGYYAAVHAFAEHYPQLIQYKNKAGDDLLILTLQGMPTSQREEAFAVADYLVEQGLKPVNTVAMQYAIMTAEKPADILEWLLKKGFPLEPYNENGVRGLPLDYCIAHNHCTDIFVELVNQGKINVNDTRGKATYLQRAATAAKVEVVELLLKLGANPDLLPEPYFESDENCSLAQTPVELVLSYYNTSSDEEVCERYLATLRILFQYNARPQPLPAKWENEDKLRAVEAIYRDFGHELTTLPSNSAT